jgi:hypothetical protein
LMEVARTGVELRIMAGLRFWKFRIPTLSQRRCSVP